MNGQEEPKDALTKIRELAAGDHSLTLTDSPDYQGALILSATPGPSPEMLILPGGRWVFGDPEEEGPTAVGMG